MGCGERVHHDESGECFPRGCDDLEAFLTDGGLLETLGALQGVSVVLESKFCR